MGVDVTQKGLVARTRDVTGHGVDRFIFSREAIGARASTNNDARLTPGDVPLDAPAASDQPLELSRADARIRLRVAA